MINRNNTNTENLLNHVLFSNQFFSTATKIECMNAVIQMTTPELYKMAIDLKPGIFNVIKTLCEFRNILAHKNSIPIGSSIFTGKHKSTFKGKPIKGEDMQIKNVFEFVPYMVTYRIDDTIQEQIFSQMHLILAFLYSYTEKYLYIDYIDSEKELNVDYEVLIVKIIHQKEFTNDKFGVCEAFETMEAKIENEKHKTGKEMGKAKKKRGKLDQ